MSLNISKPRHTHLRRNKITSCWRFLKQYMQGSNYRFWYCGRAQPVVCGVFATLGDNFSLWPSGAFSGSISVLIAGWARCTSRRAACCLVPPLQVSLKPRIHLAQGRQPALCQAAAGAAEPGCRWARVPASSAPRSPNRPVCLSQPPPRARAHPSQPFGRYGCCSSSSFLSFTKGMQPAQADNLDVGMSIPTADFLPRSHSVFFQLLLTKLESPSPLNMAYVLFSYMNDFVFGSIHLVS